MHTDHPSAGVSVIGFQPACVVGQIHASLSFSSQVAIFACKPSTFTIFKPRAELTEIWFKHQRGKSQLEKFYWLPFYFKACELLNLNIGSKGSITAILKKQDKTKQNKILYGSEGSCLILQES